MATIAAIATPLATGGISVIRVSGENSIKIVDKIFKSISGKKINALKGYTALYGKIFDGNSDVDDVVVLCFRAPKSFTGENIVEISCHGGIYITKKILRLVIENGAVLAPQGEFSKRAFLNGKISLTQAESIMDLISAQGEQASKAAFSVMEGALYKKIKDINQDLLYIVAHLGAWVDYPEEDIPVVENKNLLNSLNNANKILTELIETFDCGQILKEGISTSIIGKPNVGKSTLMNLLSGYEKSIVTDIEGTTRDIVEEKVFIDDVILMLYDTAGIRETNDIIEKYGVDLAKKKIETSDLILTLFDNSRELDQNDINLIENINSKNCIAIINKCDLQSKINLDLIKSKFEFIVEISAKDNNGLDNLKNQIKQMFNILNIDTTTGIIANERQRACAIKAKNYIEQSIEVLNSGITLDAVTISIELAIESLLELTGERITDTVVDEIFANFCVGK